MIQPGQFDQVVTLSAPTTTADRFGQHTTFDPVADCAARVRPLRGREFFAAGAMQSPASIEVEIYWRADVASNWRVAWMSRSYDVVAAPIDVDAKHATLLLMCAEVPV